MGKRADSCLIPTLALKKGETKLFQTYKVFLLIKLLENKKKILRLNLALSKINRSKW